MNLAHYLQRVSMFPPHLWTVGPRVHWVFVPGHLGSRETECEVALILEASQLKELVNLEV